MTSFRLPHLPPPYQPPCSIKMLTAHLLREPYVADLEESPVAPDHESAIDWSSVSSNVIATVLGAGVVAAFAAIFFTAYQVPRQQELILHNQQQMKEAMVALAARLDRLELNDRRQDERIIQGFKSTP